MNFPHRHVTVFIHVSKTLNVAYILNETDQMENKYYNILL